MVLGVLASQQPYNAYGVKLEYTAGNLELNAAYYGRRLDDTEYAIDEVAADHAWEAGFETTLGEISCRFYHYHISGRRSLTGAVIEHTYNRVYLALYIDWWQWNKALSDRYDRRSSIGGTFYLVPTFGKFALPIRAEYVDQGGSGIYLEHPAATRIYAATVSPTYHYSKVSYLRVESSYVHARKGFADKDGEPKDRRIYLAAEVGFLF